MIKLIFISRAKREESESNNEIVIHSLNYNDYKEQYRYDILFINM